MKIDLLNQLNQKVKDLRDNQDKSNKKVQKVYKTKFGKWVDSALKNTFSKWFEKRKNSIDVEIRLIMLGFFGTIAALLTITISAGWLSAILLVLWAAVIWKVFSVLYHAVHLWNCSLTWGDNASYTNIHGKVRFEPIVSKHVFDAALNELEQHAAAQTLVQQLRDNPLSPYDSHVFMHYLGHFCEINELELFRKGVVTAVMTVNVETPTVESTDIVEHLRTFRL